MTPSLVELGLDVAPLERLHVECFMPAMRSEDRAEMIATAGTDTAESLLALVNLSWQSYVWPAEGPIAAVFGVYAQSSMSLLGVPWLLSTPVLDSRRKEFMDYSHKISQYFLQQFPELENYVDARYKKAVRWLRWLGCTVYPPEPWGFQGLPFHRFRMQSWASQ